MNGVVRFTKWDGTFNHDTCIWSGVEAIEYTFLPEPIMTIKLKNKILKVHVDEIVVQDKDNNISIYVNGNRSVKVGDSINFCNVEHEIVKVKNEGNGVVTLKLIDVDTCDFLRKHNQLSEVLGHESQPTN